MTITTAAVPTYPQATAVILAAGKGTRMGSDLAKVLHPLAGVPLIGHVLATCVEAGLGGSVVVVGWQREAVEATVRRLAPAARFAVQDRQLGTGHAVLAAESATAQAEIIVVLCGDSPLIPAALLRQLLDRHLRSGATCTAVAARMRDPSGYGRMVTGADGRLLRIVEHRDATPAERAIDLINSGIYAFARTELFRCLHLVRPANAQGEYYLTDVVAMLAREAAASPSIRGGVELVITDDPAEVLGVNTPEDLKTAERLRRQRQSAAAG